MKADFVGPSVITVMRSPHELGIHRVLGRLRPLGQVLNYPSRRRLDAAVSIADLRRCAARRAHRMVFDYIDGGCDDETTLRRNRAAYADYGAGASACSARASRQLTSPTEPSLR
jgi:hypothetical protein